jgi:PhnB protein
MKVEPYLFFDGRCDEALDFYKKSLGAEIVMLMRYKESPAPSDPKLVTPEMADKVMHSSFRVGETVIMASDGNCTGKANFQGFSLTIETASPSEAERLFAALADGGQVQMPLTETFFSPKFGMVVDRFGVMWMVMAQS